MKIEIKKIAGIIAIVMSAFMVTTATYADSMYNIVPNPNNQYFFTSSAYARNYYRNLGYYTYENNPAAACYGLRSCYSVNYYYLNPGYNSAYNNYNYDYNYVQPNTYTSYNSYYPNYNYNTYSNPVSVASVPQYFWTN